MKKLRLLIELDYNPKIIYGSNNNDEDMLINDILCGNIQLFSSQLGDEFKNISIKEIEKDN